MEAVNRTIALVNFYGDGKHLYQDELGWWPSVKEEAHSQISRDIFEYEIVPIEFKILPVVRESRRPSLAAKWQHRVFLLSAFHAYFHQNRPFRTLCL